MNNNDNNINQQTNPNLNQSVPTPMLNPNLNQPVPTPMLNPNLNQPVPTPMPNPNLIQPEPTPMPNPNTNQPVPTPMPNPNLIQPEPTPMPNPNLNQPIPTPMPNPNLIQPEPTPMPNPNLNQPVPTPMTNPNLNQPVPTTMTNPNLNQPVPTTMTNPNLIQPEPIAPTNITNEPDLSQNIIPENDSNNAYEKQPVSVTQKKKHRLIPITILLVLLIIFGILVYINSPEKVFKSTIDKIEKTINNSLKDNSINNKLFDLKLSFSTDVKELNDLSKYTYGISGGIDSKNKRIQEKLYITDEKGQEHSYTTYLKNEKIYSLFSTYDKLIYFGEASENDFGDLFKIAENINIKDTKHLIKTISKSAKRNLNKKKLSRKFENIIINGKKRNTLKISYNIDKKEAKRFKEKILDDIFNNKQDAETIKKLTGLEKEELIEVLNTGETDTNTTETYNIYTNFFGKAVGFDIETNGKKEFSYYIKGKDFTLISNNTEINGKYKNNKLQVTVKGNKKQFATLNFDELSNNKVTFDYNISDLDSKGITGKVKYLKQKDKDNLEIKINDGQNNYNFKLYLTTKENEKIAEIDESKAVQLTEEEMEKLTQDFILSSPIGKLLLSLTGENDTTNLNYTSF